MSYRSYQAAIQPTSLQDPVSQAFMRAQGIVKDYLLERVRQGTQLRFPDYASADALGAIGADRLIDRGIGPQRAVPETDAEYAARLKAAWDIWYWAGTAYGMLQAFKAQGYFDTNGPLIIQQNGTRWNLDSGGNLVITEGLPWTFPSPNLWNTFGVFFLTPPSSWTSIVSPPTPTSAPSVNEIDRLIRIINLWKPAHMTCAGITVVESGYIWGIGTWGSPRTWGGTTTTFTIPVS